MSQEQPNNPLHGVTLKGILEDLIERHGWPVLADSIKIRCFQNNPSLKSSLKFLRKTPWACARVEALYLADHKRAHRNRKRNKRRAAMRAHKAEQEAATQGGAQVNAPGPEAHLPAAPAASAASEE